MILSFRTDMSVQTVDPDQTAAEQGAVWTGSALFAIPHASFAHIMKHHIVQILR